MVFQRNRCDLSRCSLGLAQYNDWNLVSWFLRVSNTLSKIQKNGGERMTEGRFYCKWCDNMKPVSEQAQDIDDRGFVIWIGCILCHLRRG